MKLNKKNKLLLLSFLLVLYICYSFAISNTIGYYKEYKSKQEVLFNDNNLPLLVNQLIHKEKQLDQVLLQSESNSTSSFQNDLLKKLTTYSESYNLKIVNFQEPHNATEKGVIISSYVFSLEGSFNGCLAVLNKVENNPSLGTIKHLNFIKKKNYKTNTDQLFVEIIMQKNEEL